MQDKKQGTDEDSGSIITASALPAPFIEQRHHLLFEQPRPIFDDNEEKALLKALINSRAFRKSFSQAHLKKYRDSLQLPIIDNIRLGGKEKLSIEGKIAFLESKKDIDDIVEAFVKVTKNIDKLT
jgi:hypothetical protein